MAETQIRELWGIRWPSGAVTGAVYSSDGSDHAEQTVRFLASGTDGEVVRRSETVTLTPWEPAPEPLSRPGNPEAGES